MKLVYMCDKIVDSISIEIRRVKGLRDTLTVTFYILLSIYFLIHAIAQPSPAQPSPACLGPWSRASLSLTGRDYERLCRIVEVLFGPREVAHECQLQGGTRWMKAYSIFDADACQYFSHHAIQVRKRKRKPLQWDLNKLQAKVQVFEKITNVQCVLACVNGEDHRSGFQ